MTDPTSTHVRPTKRTLDDLGLSFPGLEQPLHEMTAPIITKAQQVPNDAAAGGAERVVSLVDRVWFKCKIGNERAIVTEVKDSDSVDDLLTSIGARWWIGAAGHRQADSATDFYQLISLEASRAGRGTGRGSTSHLLPAPVDLRRLRAETATQTVLGVERIVRELIAKSLMDGKLWSATLSGHRLTANVRSGDGDTYLAICAEGFVDPNLIAVILAAVPLVAPSDWMPEPGGVMGIEPGVDQIVYSTIIPAESQALVLNERRPEI